MLRDIALEAFEGVGETESLEAVDALTDLRSLGADRENGGPRDRGAASAVADCRTLTSSGRSRAMPHRRRRAAAHSSGCRPTTRRSWPSR